MSNITWKQPKTWEELKKLHIIGDIKPGDRISTETGYLTNNLERLAQMFSGEYRVVERIADGHFQKELVRIAPSITANICHEIPESIEDLESQLCDRGHILIRTGSPLNEQRIIDMLGGAEKLMNYQYGNVERNKISNSNFLHVTLWPKNIDILPHSELTYHTEFPRYLCFTCKQPSEYGGETTIYDCQQAFANLAPNFQKEATERSIVFTKKYVKQRDSKKYISSWQQILAEDSTAQEAIAYWTQLGYSCVLHKESENGKVIDVLETRIKRPIAYSYKGKTCLHASIVGVAPYWYREVWSKQPQIEVKWENGEPFAEERFQEMENALKSARIFYNNWQKNDVLILDSLRTAHGRLPFIGDRLVGVLMAGKTHFELKDNEWSVAE